MHVVPNGNLAKTETETESNGKDEASEDEVDFPYTEVQLELFKVILTHFCKVWRDHYYGGWATGNACCEQIAGQSYYFTL